MYYVVSLFLCLALNFSFFVLLNVYLVIITFMLDIVGEIIAKMEFKLLEDPLYQLEVSKGKVLMLVVLQGIVEGIIQTCTSNHTKIPWELQSINNYLYLMKNIQFPKVYNFILIICYLWSEFNVQLHYWPINWTILWMNIKCCSYLWKTFKLYRTTCYFMNVI